MSINDFLDCMPHTITIGSFSTRDAYGAPSYGAAITYSARVTYKPSLIRAADGSQIVAKGVVWIGGTPTLSPQDELTLPDSSTPPILSIDRVSDEGGSHHVKVYFG